MSALAWERQTMMGRSLEARPNSQSCISCCWCDKYVPSLPHLRRSPPVLHLNATRMCCFVHSISAAGINQPCRTLPTARYCQDSCVYMATGTGKSLCFQLPAVVSGKVVLVACPSEPEGLGILGILGIH